LAAQKSAALPADSTIFGKVQVPNTGTASWLIMGIILFTAVNAVVPVVLLILLGYILKEKGFINKDFVKTGNTTYGVQNLEYDSYSGSLLAAVYRGQKTQYPNYSMFFIDNKSSPFFENEKERLPLASIGLLDEKSGVRGLNFPYGATGMISLGDGYFYFSHDFRDDTGWGSDIVLYRFDMERGEFTKM